MYVANSIKIAQFHICRHQPLRLGEEETINDQVIKVLDQLYRCNQSCIVVNISINQGILVVYMLVKKKMDYSGHIIRHSTLQYVLLDREIEGRCSKGIRLYRENAVAIESEAKDPFGGNVYYVTMQITLHIPKFARKERNLQCDVVHTTTKWVFCLILDHTINKVIRILLCGGNKESQKRELLMATHCIRPSNGWNRLVRDIETWMKETHDSPTMVAVVLLAPMSKNM